jgi:catechol 2,3-dioxygenase-like lactoylglutathione lyase family enzyme
VSLLPIRRLQFFTIRTRNLAAARQFYVDLLGFPVMNEKAGEYFQVEIAGVPLCVDLDTTGSLHQSNQMGIEVTDLGATREILRQKGLVVTEGSRPESREGWVSIEDPDGHQLIFIAS